MASRLGDSTFGTVSLDDKFDTTVAGGSCDYPLAADVESGVNYANGTKTGTFTAPAVGDVQTGVTYGGGGTEFTGTLDLPAVGDVQSGVQYGAGGTEFTGTFTVVSENDVQSGVTYGAGGTEFTGNFVVPTEAQVESGVNYGANGTEFTGTLSGGGGGTLSGLTYTATKDISATNTFTQGIFWNNDGTAFYTVDYNTDLVTQWDMTTAYDITTATAGDTLSIAAQEGTALGIFFKPDGTELYIVGFDADEILQWSLSTAWDLTTATYTATSTSAMINPQGVSFKPDGTRAWCVDQTGIRRFTLSTAWDVTTASLAQTVTNSTTVPMTDIDYLSDTSIIVCNNQVAFEFLMTTADDTTTGEYVTDAFCPHRVGGALIMGMNFDGTRMLIADSQNDEVHLYE